MQLLDDWRDVLARAWSLKLVGFTAFLEITSNVVPLVGDYVPWWVTVGLLVAAAVARLVKQPQEAPDADK